MLMKKYVSTAVLLTILASAPLTVRAEDNYKNFQERIRSLATERFPSEETRSAMRDMAERDYPTLKKLILENVTVDFANPQVDPLQPISFFKHDADLTSYVYYANVPTHTTRNRILLDATVTDRKELFRALYHDYASTLRKEKGYSSRWQATLALELMEGLITQTSPELLGEIAKMDGGPQIPAMVESLQADANKSIRQVNDEVEDGLLTPNAIEVANVKIDHLRDLEKRAVRLVGPARTLSGAPGIVGKTKIQLLKELAVQLANEEKETKKLIRNCENLRSTDDDILRELQAAELRTKNAFGAVRERIHENRRN